MIKAHEAELDFEAKQELHPDEQPDRGKGKSCRPRLLKKYQCNTCHIEVNVGHADLDY